MAVSQWMGQHILYLGQLLTLFTCVATVSRRLISQNSRIIAWMHTEAVECLSSKSLIEQRQAAS